MHEVGITSGQLADVSEPHRAADRYDELRVAHAFCEFDEDLCEDVEPLARDFVLRRAQREERDGSADEHETYVSPARERNRANDQDDDRDRQNGHGAGWYTMNWIVTRAVKMGDGSECTY